MLEVVCALLGLAVGWLLPWLVARLPERPVPGDPAAGTPAELGEVGPAAVPGSGDAADATGDDGDRADPRRHGDPADSADPTEWADPADPAPAAPRADPTDPADRAPAALRADPSYALIAAWPPLRPVLAVTTAGVFALLAAARGAVPDLPAFLVLGAFGVALGYVDLRRHRLPDALTGPAFAAGVLLLAGGAAAEGDWSAYGRAWLGALVLGGLYLVLALLSPAGMGLGDVKLSVVLGLHLGWLGWGILALGGFLGFLLGGVVGVLLLLGRRATLRSAVPFGPSMLLGTLVAVVWGEELLDAYLGR